MAASGGEWRRAVGGAAAGGAGAAGVGGGLAIGPVGWAALAVVGVGAVGVYAYKRHQAKKKEQKEKAEAEAKAKAEANVAVKGKDDQKPCPVCGQKPDAAAGAPPGDYLAPPRSPMDSETNPPLNSFKRTSMVVKGARVYEMPDGTYEHVDTLHKGPGSEIEMYNSRGKHTGTKCPRCGRPYPNSQVPGRTLPM